MTSALNHGAATAAANEPAFALAAAAAEAAAEGADDDDDEAEEEAEDEAEDEEGLDASSAAAHAAKDDDEDDAATAAYCCECARHANADTRGSASVRFLPNGKMDLENHKQQGVEKMRMVETQCVPHNLRETWEACVCYSTPTRDVSCVCGGTCMYDDLKCHSQWMIAGLTPPHT
jgi:hypothetical protein